MIITTGDLINFVLKASGILGIGQTAMADDLDTGLNMLRLTIAQWQKKRWLIFVQTEVSVPVSTGAQSYTIGPGCDFNINARPDHIAAAYIRILPGNPPNLVDVPLIVLDAYEDYARIAVKTLETIPAAIFYESDYPTGKIWVWPVPPAGMYGIYLVIKSPLPTYVSQTDPLDLPDEYVAALTWSLTVRMQMAYGRQAKPDQVAAMKEAMNTLRQANAQIPMLEVPVPLGRVRYDVSLIGRGLGRAFILDQGAVL